MPRQRGVLIGGRRRFYPAGDRRGRVAGKAGVSALDAAQHRARLLDADDNELDYGQVLSGGLRSMGYGLFGDGRAATLRTRFSTERERDRSFLESLRNPNPIDHDGENSDEIAGTGPGANAAEKYAAAAEAGLDWDQAQVTQLDASHSHGLVFF